MTTIRTQTKKLSKHIKFIYLILIAFFITLIVVASLISQSKENKIDTSNCTIIKKIVWDKTEKEFDEETQRYGGGSRSGYEAEYYHCTEVDIRK